jgi:hypothetical protein
MIFRQYRVFSDGDFQCEGSLSYLRGEFDYMVAADSFFSEIGLDFFPTVEINPEDKISDDYKECLLRMIFLQQLNFFISLGWIVKIFDTDSKQSKFFGNSGFQDCLIAQELGMQMSWDDCLSPQSTQKLIFNFLNCCGRKTFWVEGWNADFLIICTTKQLIKKPGAIHAT